MKLIICCGMSRSGSTLQYQIAKALIETSGLGEGVGFPLFINPHARHIQVVKTEVFTPEVAAELRTGDSIGLTIHRDPRDVWLSLQNFYTKRSQYLRETPPTATDIDTCLQNAVSWYRQWREYPNVHTCRYATYAPNLYRFAIFIQDIIGTELEPDQLRDIANSLSVLKQMEYISSLDEWFDGKNTMLTRGHISGANWLTQMPVAQVFKLQELYKRFMVENDYPIIMQLTHSGARDAQ